MELFFMYYAIGDSSRNMNGNMDFVNISFEKEEVMNNKGEKVIENVSGTVIYDIKPFSATYFTNSKDAINTLNEVIRLEKLGKIVRQSVYRSDVILTPSIENLVIFGINHQQLNF